MEKKLFSLFSIELYVSKKKLQVSECDILITPRISCRVAFFASVNEPLVSPTFTF